MENNVHHRESLLGFARIQANNKDTKTIRKKDLDENLSEGWQIQRKNTTTVRVQRNKKRADLLESRVWILLYRMGFINMSGKGGAHISVATNNIHSVKDQIDVVAVDDEVAICIECKSYEKPKRDPYFADKLARLAGKKLGFSQFIENYMPNDTKKQIGMIMFTWDYVLRESDYVRANNNNIVLFDEHDLKYYEALVKLLGPAARYQFLAEVFKDKHISGLKITVPAVRTKLGKYTFYTFSIRPEYLLKIGFVSHRAKGRAIDVDAYQRLITKSRLKQIQEYIDTEGIFPTNIVINIENRNYINFQRGKQEGNDEEAIFGWLTLSPTYGSAWIIDGQHRLYAYSGHPRSETSCLSTLAFEGLSPSSQAKLFVDINSEQRRVKRSLLVELDATLKWDSDDENKRIDAVISKASMALDENPESPLYNRVLLSEAPRSERRCISLTTLASALDKPGFFIIKKQKNFTQYGPLWRNDNDIMLRRTIFVLNEWIKPISTAAKEWWDLGAGEGGGLAMNNGVTVCFNILRSIMEYKADSDLLTKDDADLASILKPYAECIGDFFAGMNQNERYAFRQLQGADGQLSGTRMVQEAISKRFPQYSPNGLKDWIARKEAKTNEQARTLALEIENLLQTTILEMLKEEFNADDEQWWFDGVPKEVRKKVDIQINESDGKSGTREQNFNLIHYREIIRHNWQLFKDIFSYEGAGKDKGTLWIEEVNRIRNPVSHASRQYQKRGSLVSFEDIATLEKYRDWLKEQVLKRNFE